MKVRAKGDPSNWVGYYGHVRRRGGDVFELVPIKTIKNGKPITIMPEQQFSERWMERVGKQSLVSKPATFRELGRADGRAGASPAPQVPAAEQPGETDGEEDAGEEAGGGEGVSGPAGTGSQQVI